MAFVGQQQANHLLGSKGSQRREMRGEDWPAEAAPPEQGGPSRESAPVLASSNCKKEALAQRLVGGCWTGCGRRVRCLR